MVRTANGYLINSNLNLSDLHLVSKELLTDPLLQKYSLTGYPGVNFDYGLEIRYKSGVTDNVGRSARQGILDVTRKDPELSVYACRQYFFKGKLKHPDIEKLAAQVLGNSLIEDFEIISAEEWRRQKDFSLKSKDRPHEPEKTFTYLNINLNPENLDLLSKARTLALSGAEWQAIKKYYESKTLRGERKKMGLGPLPTDVELEMISQTWSEHCKHKIFAADIDFLGEDNKNKKIRSLYKTYIKKVTTLLSKKRKDLLSVFSDNAGVVKFDNQWAYCVKAETHNSPSALDPYGGAMTGIVGVNRDILGRPLCKKSMFT